jgi:hypothetical protein
LDIYKQLGNYFAQAGELDILAKVYTKLGKKKRALAIVKKGQKRFRWKRVLNSTCVSKVKALRGKQSEPSG